MTDRALVSYRCPGRHANGSTAVCIDMRSSHRVYHKTSSLALTVLMTMTSCAAPAVHQPKQGMNIMLITVDDLRPEIGSFHPWSPHDTILTPHLDSLATKGTLFTNAVVTFALCGPSRTSFLTSLRPDTTKVWTIGPFFRNLTSRGDGAVTLPQAFKNAGWHTESYGKVFHVSAGCYRRPIVTGGPPTAKGSTAGCLNDPVSWSAPAWLPDPYAERGTKEIAKGRNPTGPMDPSMLSWEAVDAPDDEFPDGNISAHANAALTRMKSTIVDQGRNFFMAVGFLKPHLPQVFPRKYLDLYAGVPMPRVASNPFPPIGSPFMAWGGVMQEISEYSNIISAKGSNKTQASYDLPTAVQVGQKRGYHAASTYIDAQIGRLLGTLDSLELRESTIVAVIGDHGWKLGEHGGWAKKTTFWNDARGLLMVSDPRQKTAGQQVDGVVEYLDLYPTLVELALPNNVIPAGLEGKSFAPLLDSPTAPHREYGFYQYTCVGHYGTGIAPTCMGYAVISPSMQLRYTAWVAFDGSGAHGQPNFDQHLAQEELYDHKTDIAENVNVASDAKFATAKATLSKVLRDNFMKAKSTRTVSTPPSVSSGDGLQFCFGTGESAVAISSVSVGGLPISPKTPKYTGFEVEDFMVNPLPTGLGPELLSNANFTCSAGADPTSAAAAANWTKNGAPGLSGTIERVSNVSRSPGGYSLMAVAADGKGAGAYQTVTAFGVDGHQPARLLLSGWSKADGVTGIEDNDYGVFADLAYNDGTHLYAQVAKFRIGTHDWQRATHVIPIAKPLKLATVYVLLRGSHRGTAYFADVSLVTAKDPAEPTMVSAGTATSQPDGTVMVEASVADPTSLSVKAVFEGHPDCIRVRGTLSRTDSAPTAVDRAVSVGLVLPVNATAWHFPSGLDKDQILGPTDDAVGVQYQNPSLPHATDFYPLMVLHNDRAGIAAGVDVDGPVFISRASYTASRYGLRVMADFALTAKSEHFSNTVNFSFIFFRVGSDAVSPHWGFRAGLEKYYSLFPVFGERIIREQGNWLVAVRNISTIENVSDFGFKFEEGGGSGAECQEMNKAKIGIFPYIEPHLVHWSLPRSSTIDYAHIIASVRSCADNTSSSQHTKALSILSAGVMDENHQYRWRPEDAEWNYGCVFWVDLDPSGRSDPHGPVAGLLSKVGQEYATARDGNYTLGGIYVDSVANAQDLLNYDPSRLRTAHYPPIFDTEGRPVVLMLQNTLAFLNFLNTYVLQPHGGVLMGNGPYYPETQYRFAPVFAVSGGETFWFNSNNKQSPFKPTSHELMALHRIMAYQRPYMPLQDSDFLEWTFEMSEQYHQVELTFGMWPGYFSHDAASRPYFGNSTWYNRDRPIFKRYVPVLQEINQAGWQPVTGATVRTATSADSTVSCCVRVERFGPSATSPNFVYFTVRNEGWADLAKSMMLTIDGKVLNGLQTGRHTVTELTRRRGTGVQVSTTPAPDGGVQLPIALNEEGGLGNVAINMTLVLKVDLKVA